MVYIFALLPAVLDSVVVFFDKIVLSKYEIDSTALSIYAGILAFLIGNIVFFFSGLHLINQRSAFIIITSGFIGVYMMLIYFKALTFDEASRVGSLFQLVPVFVFLLSFIFLKEKLQFKEYLGAFLIVMSGLMLSLRKPTLGFFSINRAFFYMLLASLMSTSIYVLFKVGVKNIGFWEALPYEGVGAGLAAISITLYKGNFQRLKKSATRTSKKLFILLTLSEITYRLSRFSFFFALFFIPASIVSILQGLQPLYLVIIGILLSVKYPKLLEEVINKKTLKIKLIAVTGLFMGIFLLFL